MAALVGSSDGLRAISSIGLRAVAVAFSTNSATGASVAKKLAPKLLSVIEAVAFAFPGIFGFSNSYMEEYCG